MTVVIESQGDVVNDVDVAADYAGAVVRSTAGRAWNSNEGWRPVDIVAFEVPDLVVTSIYQSVDLRRNRLFVNQTYSNSHQFFGTRAIFNGDRYTLNTTAERLPGKHVVLGGPIDLVWHHWLMNWAPRLSVLQLLRPDLFDDPEVKFLVDVRAAEQPYRAVLDAFGLSDDRLTFVDHAVDHQLEHGVLVSFLDQAHYYPEITQRFVRTVSSGFGATLPNDRQSKKPVRIFCSRQAFDVPRRRMANYAEVEPILQAEGFTSVALGNLPAARQYDLFRRAEVIIGVHGADLVNMIFAKPGTKVIVLENQRNLEIGLAKTYSVLAEMMQLDYRALKVDEVILPDIDYSQFGHLHNRDYVLDPDVLRRALETIERPQPPSLVQRLLSRWRG